MKNEEFTQKEIDYVKENYHKTYGTHKCCKKLCCGDKTLRRLAKSLDIPDYFPLPAPKNPSYQICRKCKQEKPITGFQSTHTKKGYKKYYCKNCRTKQNNAYSKNRAKNDPAWRIRINLKNRLGLALKNNQKSGHTLELLGCNINELKLHLEKQFKTDMSWQNYGQWHIDHIKPCAVFDLSQPDQQKICFHFSNLQPLWARDNQQKSDKF